MNIYGWNGKSIEPNENDRFYTRWIKSLRRKIGRAFYIFDSLREFKESALNEKIKEGNYIDIPNLSVDYITETNSGLNLVLKENENLISFTNIKRSDYINDYVNEGKFRCIKEKTWLDLHKLNIGDEIDIRFFYYGYNTYQLVFIDKKDDGRGGERESSSVPKEGQSIDDLIMEVFKEK